MKEVFVGSATICRNVDQRRAEDKKANAHQISAGSGCGSLRYLGYTVGIQDDAGKPGKPVDSPPWNQSEAFTACPSEQAGVAPQ